MGVSERLTCIFSESLSLGATDGGCWSLRWPPRSNASSDSFSGCAETDVPQPGVPRTNFARNKRSETRAKMCQWQRTTSQAIWEVASVPDASLPGCDLRDGGL